MKVSFEGLGELAATFYNNATDAAAAGDAVKMSGNGEIAACDASDAFCGVAIRADDEFAAVILSGYVRMPYTGSTAPAVGYGHLVSDGNGGVSAGTDGAGNQYLIVDVDTAEKTVGFIL